MSDDASAGELRAHTVRLELVDEPGELLNALEPIADNGGNLLSIFHERGSLTPRGHIPVEVDLECLPHQLDAIVADLREAGVNVIRAGTERYGEEVTVLLVGHVVETDFSETLSAIESGAAASVVDVSLSAPNGTSDVSSARLRLATEPGKTAEVTEAVREVAERKDLQVVEPLAELEGSA